MGNNGAELLREMRQIAAELGRKYDIQAVITGLPVEAQEMVGAVYKYVPLMVFCTLSFAAVFIGFMFKSVILPLRAIFCNCLIG